MASPSPSPAPRYVSWRQHLFRLRHPLTLGLTLILFGVALIACHHLLTELDPDALRAALVAISPLQLSAAVGMTVLSYAALLGYEWSASRYAQVRLPASEMMIGGFCAFGIGNAVGLSILSGGSVRYRLYSRQGLSPADIARMTLFASLALGCSLPVLAALASLSNLPAAATALRMPVWAVAALALAILLTLGLMLVRLHRQRLDDQPLADCLLVRLGNRVLRLPGPRLSLLQLALTTLDVCASAAVLYLLLPEAPPLAAFVLIYVLAVAAGMLSHVPGGVGVFEAVLLAAFAEQLGAASLAAALLLYRVIYIGLPLLMACLLLLWIEARRSTRARAAMRFSAGLGAPVLALLVFICGTVLLFSGATPAVDSRLADLSALLPHRLIEASHLGASLIGLLCLLLAQGLRRRLSAAWALTLGLLLAGALLSLLKGFDWEEAGLLSLTAVLLAAFRSAFYRRSRLFELPFSALYLAAIGCVLGVTLWLMLFVYQDVPYRHELWWQFELDADAPRALRAALGCALLLGGLTLAWLLRSAPPLLLAPTAEQLALVQRIVQASGEPDGGLALSGDKSLLIHSTHTAFLMYARKGRSLVALFDPIGPMRERAELIWQFRDLCDRHHARPVFYQVRAENLPLYMDIGLSAFKLGEEAIVNLQEFDLQDPSKNLKALRYVWNRGQREGLSLEFHEPGDLPLAELQAISDAWLQGKKVREKRFSLGRYDPAYLQHFRIVVVRDQGRAVAFSNLLETRGQTLASLDLMRMLPDASKLTMEFLIIGLLLYFKACGVARFSLGMAPLSGLQPRRGAPISQRLGALLFQRGEHFYNFRGLRQFKEKFHPQWEPRYMATPAGLDPLLAVADTANLIAGGLYGLIKR